MVGMVGFLVEMVYTIGYGPGCLQNLTPKTQENSVPRFDPPKVVTKGRNNGAFLHRLIILEKANPLQGGGAKPWAQQRCSLILDSWLRGFFISRRHTLDRQFSWGSDGDCASRAHLKSGASCPGPGIVVSSSWPLLEALWRRRHHIPRRNRRANSPRWFREAAKRNAVV
jgi:hypothetical protein